MKRRHAIKAAILALALAFTAIALPSGALGNGGAAASPARTASQAKAATNPAAAMDYSTAYALHLNSSVVIANAGKAAASAGNGVALAAWDISDKSPALTAYLHGDTTYVPLSFVEKRLGAKSEVDESNGALRISSGGKNIHTLKSSQYDVAASYDGEIIEAFVPLRAVAEKLGKAVEYHDGLILVGDPAKKVSGAPETARATVAAGAAAASEAAAGEAASGAAGAAGEAASGAAGSIGAAELNSLKLSLAGARPVGNEARLKGLLDESSSGTAFLGSRQVYGTWLDRQLNYDSYYYEEAPLADMAVAAAGEAQDTGAMPGALPNGDRGGAAAAGTGAGGPGMAAADGAAGAEPAIPAPQPTSPSYAGNRSEGDADGSTGGIAGGEGGVAGGTGDAIAGGYEDYAAVAGSSADSSPVDQEAGADDDYSRTNTQVEGVDESDVVKTDGKYIYYVNNMRVLIVEAYPPSGMRIVGRIDYAGSGADADVFARDYPVADDSSSADAAGSSSADRFARSAFNPMEIYVDGDRLVVIGTAMRSVPAPSSSDAASPSPASVADGSSVAGSRVAAPSLSVTPAIDIPADYDYGYAGYGYPMTQDTTLLLSYDITDRANPKLTRETEVDGYYNTSRKIGNSVYIVTNKSNYYGYKYGYVDVDMDVGYAADVEPALEQGASAAPETKLETVSYRDTSSGGTLEDLPLNCVFYFPGQLASNYLVVAGVDVADAAKPASVEAVMDDGGSVYASSGYLYCVSTVYTHARALAADNGSRTAPSSAGSGPVSAIHRFRLDGSAVSYDGRGEVPGTVNDQFSMDQYGEWFRLATTTSAYSNERGYHSSNNLYVLDSALTVVGRLEDLAPDEIIYSARFMGERAYVVTFKTVDPLFVIDLSEPANPRVLGALKIPGYSDYLHPYDENHIIGFGKDTFEYSWSGDANDATAFYEGLKVALFDVSDVANPKELWKTTIGDRGTDSDLLRNHKALLFSKEKNLLAFPVTLMEKQSGGTGNNEIDDRLDYGTFSFQGAYVYNLDLETGFTLRGRITHLSDEDYIKSGSFGERYGEKHISRILQVRDTLYALSGKYITASDMATVNETGRLDVGR